MKFSNMCDYNGKPHFICKTGRKNVRILDVGQPYEKSFVVPINRIGNRRPADVQFEDDPASEDVLDADTPARPRFSLPGVPVESVLPR